jgi:hypothetical protein
MVHMYVKPNNSLVPAGRNVYRKKYPKKWEAPSGRHEKYFEEEINGLFILKSN